MNQIRMSLLVFVCACGGDQFQTVGTVSDDSGEERDETPPTIEHDPVTDTQTYQQPVFISAVVQDDLSGVLNATVWYHQEGVTKWTSQDLLREGDSDTFSGEIPGSDVESGGIYYYLSAVDLEDNEIFEPQDGASDAIHFRISVD